MTRALLSCKCDHLMLTIPAGELAMLLQHPPLPQGCHPASCGGAGVPFPSHWYGKS